MQSRAEQSRYVKQRNMDRVTHNKRMQPDQPTRYARGLAADAGRCVT